MLSELKTNDHPINTFIDDIYFEGFAEPQNGIEVPLSHDISLLELKNPYYLNPEEVAEENISFNQTLSNEDKKLDNKNDNESIIISAELPFNTVALPKNVLDEFTFCYDGNNNNNSDDDESILDTSWMKDIEKYHQISTNKERELTDSIGCYFIYINRNLYIEKILSEKCPLEIDSENGVSILPNKTILKIIQDKKMLTPVSKYKLIDILSFVVDIEPEKVQHFSQNSDNIEDFSQGFFKVLPIVNDIRIDKSIFIFHNVNHLYFIFQEVDLTHSHRTTLKSILKKTVGGTLKNKDPEENPVHHNNNKKVRIITEPRELAKSSQKKHRFTKKNYNLLD